MRANAIFSALARYGFVSSRFCQKYGLPNSSLALTYKSSHILIPEMPDSIKFQQMCFRNCWYANIFESMLTIRSPKQMKLGHVSCWIARENNCQEVKVCPRIRISTKSRFHFASENWDLRALTSKTFHSTASSRSNTGWQPEVRKSGSFGSRQISNKSEIAACVF